MQKPIKLDDILQALETTDGIRWYLDRDTGEVVMISDDDDDLFDDDLDVEKLPEWRREQAQVVRAIDDDVTGERFLSLPDRHDLHEWKWMQQFATEFDDERASESLLRAIHGSGAFRSFKNMIHHLGVQDRWYAFRNAKFREVAIDWCEANELEWIEQRNVAAVSDKAGQSVQAHRGTTQRKVHMTPLDYGRSFVLGNGGFNQVRFVPEARLRVIEPNGTQEDYIHCAACKSEDTFAEKDLFYPDNYDFTPIFGPKVGVVFRRRSWLNPNYKSIVPSEKLWEGQVYRLIEAARHHELTSNAEIIDATLAWKPIVTQTELIGKTGRRVIIECPVKTLNTNREKNAYQTDTGPIAWLDPDGDWDTPADGIALAFIAFNAPHFADFVIERPTPALSPDLATDATPRTYHFSERRSMPAVNRVFALEV